MGAPHSERLRVCLQAFGVRQRNARRCDAANSCARNLLAGNDAHEIQHTETAAHTGHAACRQHVIRSGNVISRGWGRELVEKNRARMLHCRGQRRWNRKMLGRDAIRYLDGLLQAKQPEEWRRAGRAIAAAIGFARVRFCTCV